MSLLIRTALFAALGLSASFAGLAAPPPATTDDWPIAAPASHGLDAARLAALDAAIRDGQAPDTTSVLVVHQGALVHEAYFNGADRTSLHNTRSLTKSVTAMLVGAAIDRGMIAGAGARVLGFFPDRVVAHPGAFKDAITIEDLLSMSAAWECDDNNEYSAGHEERMYVSADWTGFTLDLPERGYAPWVKRPADSPHGRSFAYCTANSFLLGAIIERASGMPLERFAKEALEHPLGIETSVWQRASEGVGMGGGGTEYRSRDLARLGQLILDHGRWKGRQILSSSWVDAMTQVRAQTPFDADYGYQMWRFPFTIGTRQVHAWTMSGNGGNAVFVVPEKQLVVVITRTRFNQRGMHQETQKLLQEYILNALP